MEKDSSENFLFEISPAVLHPNTSESAKQVFIWLWISGSVKKDLSEKTKCRSYALALKCDK